MAVLLRQCSVIYKMYLLLVCILLTHDDAIWRDHDAMAHNIPTVKSAAIILTDQFYSTATSMANKYSIVSCRKGFLNEVIMGNGLDLYMYVCNGWTKL